MSLEPPHTHTKAQIKAEIHDLPVTPVLGDNSRQIPGLISASLGEMVLLKTLA